MKNRYTLTFIIFFFLTMHQVSAQRRGPVFNDNIVPRIDITISTQDSIFIFENNHGDEERPVTFAFTSPDTTAIVEEIGFRLRGNTSRDAQKQSFRVSFNTYQQGGRFIDLKKLNFNGEHNDPSISRSKLCWEIVRDFGLPGPRVNHIELYMNGTYLGLYVNIEQYNDDFLKLRFGNHKGNLYKCTSEADLTDKGTNPDNYKIPAYDLRTNTEENDYSDLAHFIQVLNKPQEANFKDELEKVFNVNGYLKALAVEVITGHWDGYTGNKNNYYLYNNPATGKFEYILYDMDNTFGIAWDQNDWAEKNIYNWKLNDEPRPLTQNILAIPEYKDRFSFYVDQLLTRFFNEKAMNSRINKLKNVITDAAERDTYKSLDYGFTNEDFHNSFKENFNKKHVKYGILPYVKKRNTFARNQLNLRPNPGINLHINEFMASNGETIANEFGKFEDWIELYNSSEADIWLGDKFLTDNLRRPEKWQMPDITLSAGEFILFWADGSDIEDGDEESTSLGSHHAPYKLSRSGEQVGIFDAGFAPIDTMTFGEQIRDISFGRFPDGTGKFFFMQSPTPGKPNKLTPNSVSDDISNHHNQLTLAPNPFNRSLNLIITTSKPSSQAQVVISDLSGRIVSDFNSQLTLPKTILEWNGRDLNGKPLPGGVYIIKLMIKGEQHPITQKVIIQR
jgi:spore coat protein CotH